MIPSSIQTFASTRSSSEPVQQKSQIGLMTLPVELLDQIASNSQDNALLKLSRVNSELRTIVQPHLQLKAPKWETSRNAPRHPALELLLDNRLVSVDSRRLLAFNLEACLDDANIVELRKIFLNHSAESQYKEIRDWVRPTSNNPDASQFAWLDQFKVPVEIKVLVYNLAMVGRLKTMRETGPADREDGFAEEEDLCAYNEDTENKYHYFVEIMFSDYSRMLNRLFKSQQPLYCLQLLGPFWQKNWGHCDYVDEIAENIMDKICRKGRNPEQALKLLITSEHARQCIFERDEGRPEGFNERNFNWLDALVNNSSCNARQFKALLYAGWSSIDLAPVVGAWMHRLHLYEGNLDEDTKGRFLKAASEFLAEFYTQKAIDGF